MLKKHHEYAKGLLKERNLKATTTRIQVISLISAYKTAMPLSKIQQSLANTDRVTLYRTLNALLEKGLIHKAFSSGEDTYYALCSDSCSTHAHQHDHIHFKCKVCQMVTCEYPEEKVVVSFPGFKVDSLNVSAVGVCGRCA